MLALAICGGFGTWMLRFVLSGPLPRPGNGTEIPYKVMVGNVGYVGVCGLTCESNGGTSLAHPSLTECRNRCLSCVNRRLLAMLADVGAPLAYAS